MALAVRLQTTYVGFGQRKAGQAAAISQFVSREDVFVVSPTDY